MGGSSTQLIYMEKDPVVGEPLKKDDFWLHSWLGFGVERMREKVLDRVIEKHLSQRPTELELSPDGESSESTLLSEIVNPCSFVGHDEIHAFQGRNFTMRGSGDGANCVRYIKSVMWNEKDKKERRCGKDLHDLNLDKDKRSYRPGEGRFRAAVSREVKKLMSLIQDKLQGSNVEDSTMQEELSSLSAELASLGVNVCPLDTIVPPKLTGHFYAMSVYFYAIDCIRHYGHFKIFASWPTPKLDDIEKAALSFCNSNWDTVRSGNTFLAICALYSKLNLSKLLIYRIVEKHKYTRDWQLQNRCFEGLYISTLLEHGFGIDGSQKMVTLALEVEGVEVEWTLGFALAEL